MTTPAQPIRLTPEQRLAMLSNRRQLRMGTKAGLAPIDTHVDVPTPEQRLATLSENIGQRADAIGPRAPIRGEAEPTPPPELTPVTPGEARLGDVADRLHQEAARRGMVRLLGGPGAAATATTVERILGENLPGGLGERFRNVAGAHEEEEQAAREQHPVAGAASDVGALALQLEALGRLPGPLGRIFSEEAVGGAPATRGLFEGGRLTATLEREGVGTVRDRLARAAALEGRRFGALEAGKSAAEHRPIEEVVESGAAGAAGGAAFGGAAQGLAEVASPLIRSTLRGMARRNMPPMESPFLEAPRLASTEPRALLAPPPEPGEAAGSPTHVVNAGKAQRVALELTGQSPDPQLPGQPVAGSSAGQSVAPIGTDVLDPQRLLANELRDLTLRDPKTWTIPERARIAELQQQLAAAPQPERPADTTTPAAGSAAALPEREIPAEPPASLVPETPYEPPRPKPIVMPEGAPEVLGGEAADVGRHAPQAGDVGTLPQPRRKNFKTYDDAALEARWTEISDRMEAMARQRDEGTTPWVRKEERSAGAGSSGGRGFGGYSREKGVLTGTAINASGGRAIGRMKDDTRILGELEREFHARGINPADVMDRYIERANRLQAEQESGAERRALENQDEGGGDTSFEVREERGFHGSPYRFEGPFAQSKIGSGQGAASYGHGHYFAQEKATARTYRPRQAVKVSFDGAPIPDFVWDRKADDARATSKFFSQHGIATEDEGALIDALNFVNAQGSVEAARAELKLGPDDWRTRGALHALDYYGDKIAAEQAGAVYNVQLNVEPHEWLDWDKRLADQSEHVQTALKDLLRSAWRGNWTGADLYRALEAPTSTEGVVVSLGSGKEASHALRSLGIKGVRYLDQLSREPGKAAKTYNFVVFDAQDIGESTRVEEGKGDYSSKSPEIPAPALTVLHNLTPENLRAADKLGGFPVPSLAVLPEHVDFDQYGGITLIGKAELGDPSKVEIYDADAYTGRNPPPLFPAVKTKIAEQFIAQFKDAATEFGESWLLGTIWDELVNHATGPRPAQLEHDLGKSLAVRALYLRAHGGEASPVIRDVPLYSPLSSTPALRSFFDARGIDGSARPGDPYWTDLGTAVRAAIEEHAHGRQPSSYDKEIRNAYVKQFFDEDGDLLFGRASHLLGDATHYGQREVDPQETAKALFKGYRDEATGEIDEHYRRWLDDKIRPLMGAPYLKLKGRKVPYTLENVVAATKGQPATEGGMTFGPGTARAANAQQLTELTWLRNAISGPTGVLPRAEVDAARKKLEKLQTEWRDQMLAYYRPYGNAPGDTWTGLDEMHKAIARWGKLRGGKGRTVTNLRTQLARSGFRNVPDDVLELGVQVGRGILHAPVPYFEGKPTRAVQFNEFAGAVIPEPAPSWLPEILDRRGIPYRTYPVHDSEARARVTREFRRELHETGSATLFEHRLVPSPWLDKRAAVTETDAAFGGEQQMQLALDKAVEQLQLKPEKPAAKPVRAEGEKPVAAVAHYRQRAAAARKIVADLKKGQATWIGRQFPNVWPQGAQPRTATDISRLGLPIGERKELPQQSEYQPMIDTVGAMLQTLRSPFLETLVLFATRNDVIVAAHVLTSGELNHVTIEAGKGKAQLDQRFFVDAARAGATHIHTGHNHPSGNPEPSGLGGDIGFFAGMAYKAREFGMQPGVNLVIDDTTYTMSQLTDDPTGGFRVEPKYLNYSYSPKVPWFTAAPGLEPNVHSPEGIVAILHKLGKERNGYLIHLSAAMRVVGLDPFTPADVGPDTNAKIEHAVAAAARRYGASQTIAAVSDLALFAKMQQHYAMSPTMIRGLVDIVAFDAREGRARSARQMGLIKIREGQEIEKQFLATVVGRRIHEPGPMADPWRGQPGYVTDPAVLGARPIVVPRGIVADGPLAVREGLGPAYGEDNLPNAASIIAQEAIDAAEKLGIAPAAEGTVEKLVTAFAGTRLEQIGGPLHLVLVEYERQRVELEQAVQKDIVKESLNKAAVEFMARLPYFNEFRAVSLLAWLRDKLPRAIGKSIGVTPDRQEALFNAAEAIAEFDPDGAPVFRDVLERSGQLDETGYQRLVEIYGHPAKLELEVEQLKKAAETIRHDLVRPSVTLSPANYAVERYKLGARAKQAAKKGQAEQILSALKSERNAKKQELTELKGQRDLHAKEGILDDDAAAALPAEIERTARELDSLRAQISRFEGLVAGRTPAGPAVDVKELPAELKKLDAKLAKWRELRGKAKETDEVLRARWSNLRAFREAYEARSAGRQAGTVRITAAEAKQRWDALSTPEQGVVRRFALDADRAKQKGLAGHVNRELAKLEYEISSDIEAYVHHYGFEDEGAMTLWFGSSLRRKKMIAGARQHRGGVEGFKRHLEGARLHGGLPLSLQKLQNEFAEALERVMFTAPDPNLVRPLGADEEPPEGYSRVLGRFGEFQGQAYAVANPIYKELEFFQTRPPVHPTTDARANRAWELVKKGVSRAVYYWALNQLVSVGTAVRNFYGGAIQYATLVAEDLAGGDLVKAQHHLLALAKALSPSNAREFPSTEFGASQQTLRELDQAHGLFRAFMNVALLPFGMVENFFKRALTIGTRELEAQRIAKELLEGGKITKEQLDQVVMQLFDAPTFEMRAAEELVRDAFAYNYNNIPLALKKMNKSAIGKALIPFPIYGYKFSRHVGRYTGAISRLARMKGRSGDLQKAIAAIIIFGLPAVLTWLGDDEGKAKTTDPGSGIKYDFDRSGRVYLGLNDEGRELWMRTNSYSFYGLGATVGHVAHDRSLTEAKNYLADFYSVGPGFQAADYLRQVRNRYQAYRNNASIAGDFARSWIPFHRPLETATRMVDPIRRKQESFTESMLYAVPIPEPVLNQFGLSRGAPRTAMGGAQLVPGYNPLLEFLKEFGGINIKPIDPKQAQDEYRRAAIRTQARERRTGAESQRLRRLEQRQRERQQ